MISAAKLKHVLSDFLYFIDTYIISHCKYSSYFTSPVNRQRDTHLPSKSMGRARGVGRVLKLQMSSVWSTLDRAQWAATLRLEHAFIQDLRTATQEERSS